mgnify:CR=1 FL=1
MPQTTVTTDSVLIARRNPYRRSLIFHNRSVNIIFVNRGGPSGLTTANAGVRIPAGATRTFDWLHDGADALADEWSAISDTGSNTLDWDEYSSVGMPVAKFEVMEEAK